VDSIIFLLQVPIPFVRRLFCKLTQRFVTWYQLIVALVLLVVWGRLGKTNPLFSLVPPYEFDPIIARKVAPLTVVYVLMLAFNNLCLQYVEVTFYQVARSLTILFNIIFTYTMLGQMTSTNALFACAVVFLGFVLGSAGEINFSWLGIIFGLGSSCFVALYGIYVKKTLTVLDNNQWRLLHYNTTISIAFTFPLVLLSGELGKIRSTVDFLSSFNFWFVMTLTGVTGFLINISTFLQIKYTSPLTNTISGTAKGTDTCKCLF
jgi:GDP-fucose transporter C1